MAGEGAVETSTVEHIVCAAGGECAAELPAGTTVTLRAEPDVGYEFAGWRFCDDARGDLCTVTVGANRIVGADCVSAMPLTLHDEVVAFDDRLDQIEAFDPDTGVFRLRATAGVSDIRPGTVLLSGALDDQRDFPSAFARVVRQVDRTPGASTRIETREATLDQVIRSGTLRVRKSIYAEDVIA